MTKLPCENLKAELSRLSRVHGRDPYDADMNTEWRDNRLCLVVRFADGMAWVVPFDPEAQDVILARQSTKH